MPRKTGDPLLFFLAGHTASVNLKRQNIRFSKRLANFFTEVGRSRDCFYATPGTVWGSPKHCHHLTHPSHTRVQIQSRRNARMPCSERPCSLGHTSLSDLVHITCDCTRPGETVVPAFLRAGDCHLRRRNKPCSRPGLQRMYRRQSSAITST